MKRMVIFAAALLAILAVMPPAGAADQIITASIGSSVTMSTNPTETISNWSLSALGANTTSGGSVGVSANVPYTLTVVADKAKMSEYNTGSSAYVSGGKTLTNALSVVPVLSSGTGVPVASVAVGTSASALAAGVGLSTDVYDLTLSQTTLITDEPLASGRVYRIVLTYTAAAL